MLVNTFRPAPSSKLNRGQVKTFQGLESTQLPGRGLVRRNDNSHSVTVQEGVQGLVASCLPRRPGGLLERPRGKQWRVGAGGTHSGGNFHGRKWPTSDWSLEESKKAVGKDRHDLTKTGRKTLPPPPRDFPQPYWRGKLFSFGFDLAPFHSPARACDLGRNQHSRVHLGLQLYH